MKPNDDLMRLVNQLKSYAYSELIGSNILAVYGKTSSFAVISWSKNLQEIAIKCNNTTRKWHEAALIGLLSHEMSHTNSACVSETATDIDVIKRGLGPYLAVERILTGKYEDHIIQNGKDLYLGYSSIRKHLSKHELSQLDALLTKMRLIPKRRSKQHFKHHDILVKQDQEVTKIRVDGYEFTTSFPVNNIEISLLEKGDMTFVYVNGGEIGSY
ncbi:MAG: hypothetical protein JW779_04835 [Candidatus Thorarchaeota archaeon]|nr:hypothetical protein [Candidatus Thorarchaeota archaeon]